MTKSITSGMRTHLDETTTSLCSLWRVTRRDTVEFFFTDHDEDLVFEGNTYKAAVGYDRTALSNSSTLAVDNQDIKGIFNSDDITEDDLRAGLFNYAEIRVSTVNWQDLSLGEIKLQRGTLGEVIVIPQGNFQVELRSLTQSLSQTIGSIYTSECRTDIGSPKCKIPIRPALRLNATHYAKNVFIRVPTDGGVVTTILDEPTQDAYEDRIYECTTAGYTAVSQPAYDTSIGATTSEDGLKAHAWLLFGPSYHPITNGHTIGINGRTYTFQTVLTDVDGHVLIGADNEETRDNLIAAINLDAGAGTIYAASMTANISVSASALAGAFYRVLDEFEFPMLVEALTFGEAANAYAVSSSSAPAAGWVDIPALTTLTTLEGGQEGAVFTCRNSWSRMGVVDTVTDNVTFTLDIDEDRAVDDWFALGALTFETGLNEGVSIEVRQWVQSTKEITLFLPTFFDIQVGDKVRVYPGCDHLIATCSTKFDNVINFRGEPLIPGQDAAMYYPDAQA